VKRIATLTAVMTAACHREPSKQPVQERTLAQKVLAGDKRVCFDRRVHLAVIDRKRKEPVPPQVSDEDWRRFSAEAHPFTFEQVRAVHVDRKQAQISCTGDLMTEMHLESARLRHDSSPVVWHVRVSGIPKQDLSVRLASRPDCEAVESVHRSILSYRLPHLPRKSDASLSDTP
jgi:hypothetical protein